MSISPLNCEQIHQESTLFYAVLLGHYTLKLTAFKTNKGKL